MSGSTGPANPTADSGLEESFPMDNLSIKPATVCGSSDELPVLPMVARPASVFRERSSLPVMELERLEQQDSSPRQMSSASRLDLGTSAPTKFQENLYLAVVCWGVSSIGWSDGSVGPLLLRMEANYNVGFAVISCLFLLQFLGYVVAGLLNVALTDKYGFGKIIVIGSLCQITAFAVQSTGPSFPVFGVAFVINGFGAALLAAHSNTFVASLPNSAPKLGLMHATYALGAFASPLAATQFAQLPHWSYQYLFSLGIAVLELVAFILCFRFKRLEDLLGRSAAVDANSAGSNKYRQIFRLKTVHVLSFFAFVYTGIEVTIGGWIVTYLVQFRGGGPSTGYVSSGFFGGLTLGRVALLWVNAKVGPRRVVFVYCVLVMVLEFIVWFVPSLIADAISASLVGFLIGPWFPLVIGMSGQVLPHWLLPGSIGWIGSFGQAGSAVFPFLTGVLAQKFGVKVMQPLIVSMLVVCCSLWWMVPVVPRRTE